LPQSRNSAILFAHLRVELGKKEEGKRKREKGRGIKGEG
jgi:hypothetical protein